MSQNYSPTDTRPIFVQNPRLSDDSEVDKNSSVPTLSKPTPLTRDSSGVAIIKKSK